ncbi:hypothetical protein ACOKM5_43130 [Streptomyces sp. BH097]|uniref:hypothetical protein n=1 Tax=unclassified Streptomyces TaxID=2593676 RepID=UPI003BB57CAE
MRPDDADAPELMISPPRHLRPRCLPPPRHPVSQTLDDGDVIDLGDRRFTVLHLPGHGPSFDATRLREIANTYITDRS